jgi:hypothetical protein
METKFTKGKWEVKEYTCLETNIKVGEKRIAQVKHFNQGKKNDYFPNDAKIEEGLANSKLIASAPEMFEILKTIHLSFGGGNIITFSEKDIEDIQQLLTKITE